MAAGLIVSGLSSSTRTLAALDASLKSAPRDGSFFAASHFDGKAKGFLEFARQRIPSSASYRVVQKSIPFGPHDVPVLHHGVPLGVCGYGPAPIYAPYLWITFAMLPRASTCDSGEWTIYFEVPADRFDPRDDVASFSPGYAVGHRRQGT